MICTCPCMFFNFYLSVHWSLLVNTAGNTSQIQQWNAGKGCQIISKLTVKTFRVTYLCPFVSQVTLFLFFCFCFVFCFFLLTLTDYITTSYQIHMIFCYHQASKGLVWKKLECNFSIKMVKVNWIWSSFSLSSLSLLCWQFLS